ncbi:MAG: AAA family ATPase [Patescibacteria group bacterium]
MNSITGLIKTVGDSYLTVTDAGNNKFRLQNPNFYDLPYEKGDRIVAYFDDAFTIIRFPFVQIGGSKDVIIDCFVRALHKQRFFKENANDLYATIALNGDRQGQNGSDPGSFLDSNNGETKYLEKEKRDILSKWWKFMRIERQFKLYGFTKHDINACSELDLADVKKICETNPYKLLFLPIETCDQIVSSQALKLSKHDRICGLAMRAIHKITYNNGWMCAEKEHLESKIPGISNFWDKLKSEYNVVEEYNSIYLPEQRSIENGFANQVTTLLSHSPGCEYEYEVPIHLTSSQVDGVREVLSSPISIITGPAGSGKSTLLKVIVDILDSNYTPYVLASFTGKAVSRIQNIVKRRDRIMTLHRLLTMRELKFKYLIIDEASMVTTDLIYNVIKTFGTGFKLSLFGDPNQLPPIGPGSAFEELIKCGKIPRVHLDIVHRQNASGDVILENSLRMVEGSEPFHFETGKNLRFISDNPSLFIESLKQKNIKGNEFVILSPYNKYLSILNEIASKIYNGEAEEHSYRNTTYRVGDRVMMLENNYTYGVYNGEEGEVVEVPPTGPKISFNGIVHHFLDDSRDDDLDLRKISHSYAQTIHKSQGSEYKYVLLYLPEKEGGSGSSSFLNKSLMYTALTRASKMFLMIGNRIEIENACSRPKERRYEHLSTRLL